MAPRVYNIDHHPRHQHTQAAATMNTPKRGASQAVHTVSTEEKEQMLENLDIEGKYAEPWPLLRMLHL